MMPNKKTLLINMEPVESYIKYVKDSPANFAKITKQCIERVDKTCKIVRSGGSIIYNEAAVEKVFKFFAELRGVGGRPIELIDWQRFLLACVYGFMHKTEKRILYNDVFLFIAKKNGKTAFSAGNALYRFFSKKGAKVYLTATDYEQAKLAQTEITQFIKNTPRFAKIYNADQIKIRELPTPLIGMPSIDSRIQILPETRADQAQGRNPSFILYDEIASYTTSEIMQKLTTGIIDPMAARFSLTTAETNIDNPGYFEHQRAKSILDGKADAPNYLPLIYELDPKDNRWDETKYIKANPSLDVIKPLWKLVEDRDRAKNDPLEESAFFAYHLNVWSNAPVSDISMETWQPAIEQYNKYREYLTDEALVGCEAFSALDLSRSDDYTAFSTYFYIKPIDRFYAKHRFYLPAGQVERRYARESEQLRVWIKQGWVTLTYDGNDDTTVNYETVGDDVLDTWKKYQRIMGVAYDKTFMREYFNGLSAENERGTIMVAFEQGYKKIAPANRDWLELVLKGKLIDPNPVMRWMVGNVKRREDRNKNISFVKANYAQSNLRIDGIDTSVMAYKSLIDNMGKTFTDEEVKASVAKAIDLGTQYGY
jgi:phage terminase large subunit-like protein